MSVKARRRGNRGGLCFVVATMVLVTACGRAASVSEGQRNVPAEPVKIDAVDIRAVDSRMVVHYRTPASSGDCKAQAAEMPKVWDQIVKSRLRDTSVQRVVLFPEDASGQSVGFEFTKSASGQWSVAAPCSIRIPGS